jgi:hypothetical protein
MDYKELRRPGRIQRANSGNCLKFLPMNPSAEGMSPQGLCDTSVRSPALQSGIHYNKHADMTQYGISKRLSRIKHRCKCNYKFLIGKFIATDGIYFVYEPVFFVVRSHLFLAALISNIIKKHIT